MTQVTDPAVSRRKFDHEVGQLRAMEPTLIARGWWIMRAEFPFVKVAFATANMKPRMIPFAVLIDFTDYDHHPLKISFVDPFEERTLLPSEMMVVLKRQIPPDPSIPTEVAAQIGLTVVNLYQFYPDRLDLPGFLCLPGTRDYHDHPAHSGDHWELHRASGEGCLINILDKVWLYGTNPIDRLGFQIGFGLEQSVTPP